MLISIPERDRLCRGFFSVERSSRFSNVECPWWPSERQPCLWWGPSGEFSIIFSFWKIKKAILLNFSILKIKEDKFSRKKCLNLKIPQYCMNWERKCPRLHIGRGFVCRPRCRSFPSGLPCTPPTWFGEARIKQIILGSWSLKEKFVKIV